ncbi:MULTISPECIES: endonuclease/exonuclease/phosphatase family protein [Caballeronia]|jgi:endonuclease/exonuclease/phosphatase family metal-dependent hydrolase|uniref:Endonuclease n=1 Tax=Caballeronia zhejiangensis TaxID=871203 RepID=A0A656QU51_9BURK|nr:MULTISPECIES: endonuclease/exonuclease/phosphatase family protein [Caballeronia]EKS69690.1 endonuclease/exonuclease/phosphatase [Burkholderia sp. SJ98]KDR32577.1 endonuclease [Caballeronia zhejiangensis]MDR5767282.1 endonuclease/exonuclease/phosphatase family protein [Caballeronia sp. LZ028]MDR5791368.1 endonuclease/exonuclease/phosphatase family protein [Caballeronia sp. LP003]
MRLVDWNIQWGRGVDGRVDLARIVAEAKALHDFDVLCLQEVTRGFHESEQAGGLKGGPGADQFAELEALIPGATVIDGIGSDLPPVGAGIARRQFGNAIVSRLPVRQVLRHSLPWPADPAKPSMLRVALEAVIETDVGPLRIVSTHLEFYSEKQRLAQVARLRELHAEACAHERQPAKAESQASPFADTARPASAIVCGDFNSAFDGSAYRAMLEPIADAPAFVDAWTCAHPNEPRAATVGLYDRDQWPDGPFACDFIFVSEDLKARIAGCEADQSSRSSDHQPMWLELH